MLSNIRKMLRFSHPRGTLIADQRRAGEARPKGKSGKQTEESLLSSGRFRLFPATGQISSNAAKQLNSISFHVTHRFFGTFLVRPALLPYGKRGFRAAICKIARPQPPTATL